MAERNTGLPTWQTLLRPYCKLTLYKKSVDAMCVLSTLFEYFLYVLKQLKMWSRYDTSLHLMILTNTECNRTSPTKWHGWYTMQRGSFFVKEYILANMSFLSYAHVLRCVRHALEPTDHRLMYADDIMICAVSPHPVVAIRSAWFNAPSFFLCGQQQQWIGQGGSAARPCWPIVAATISNMQWGTGPTVWTRIVKTCLFQ